MKSGEPGFESSLCQTFLLAFAGCMRSIKYVATSGKQHLTLPCGLTARIGDLHSLGRGSIPRTGKN